MPQPKLTGRQTLAMLLGKLARRAMEVPEDRLALDHTCLKLAEEIISLLGTDARPETRVDRRGRPRTHDMGFAQDCLISMAIENPDGLPAKQWVLAVRLADRFKEAGKPVPGLTWLGKVVGKFYRSSNRLTSEAKVRYWESAELQHAFSSETAYVSWRKRSLMLEGRWYESADLQERFASPYEYILSRAPPPNLRLFADDGGDHACHQIGSDGSVPENLEVRK